MIVAPPSEIDAPHHTVIAFGLTVAPTATGGEGIWNVLTDAEGFEACEGPPGPFATTRNVYEVPSASPLKTQVSSVVSTHAAGAVTDGDDETV